MTGGQNEAIVNICLAIFCRYCGNVCVKLLQRSSDINASQVSDTGLNSNSCLGKNYSYRHKKTSGMWNNVAEFSGIYSYICALWGSTERMHKASNKPFSDHGIIADSKCARMF